MIKTVDVLSMDWYVPTCCVGTRSRRATPRVTTSVFRYTGRSASGTAFPRGAWERGCLADTCV